MRSMFAQTEGLGVATRNLPNTASMRSPSAQTEGLAAATRNLPNAVSMRSLFAQTEGLSAAVRTLPNIASMRSLFAQAEGLAAATRFGGIPSMLANLTPITSLPVASSSVLHEAVSRFSQISSAYLKQADIASIVNPMRFGITSSELIGSRGLGVSTAVDRFGVAALSIQVGDGRSIDRAETARILSESVRATSDVLRHAFPATERGAPPFLVSIDELDEQGIARNKRAYAALLAFELKIRRLIVASLERKYGHKWIKTRVPGDIRAAWQEKKAAAADAGNADEPLINYADFTDYVKIIVRADNWKECFESIFGRKELVQESLLRLHPLRLKTMHARILSEDDELWLRSELRLMIKRIDC
jgi:Swt1-like HEPN